jgi:hypothetical protein
VNVCVALVIQHAMRLRNIVLFGLFHSIIISTLSQKRHDLKKKGTEHKVCVVIFSTTFFWNIPHSKKNRARYDQKICIGLRIKYPLFLSDFNETRIFLDSFFLNIQV